MCVFHRRVFAWIGCCGLWYGVLRFGLRYGLQYLCVFRYGIEMLCGSEAILELYSLEALLKLQLDGGIIHIRGVTISIIVFTTIIIIIIHNVGMCGSIPSRNWTVVIVVIKLILCAIPYKEGRVWNRGICWLCSGSLIYGLFCSCWCGTSSVIISIIIGGIDGSVRCGLN